MSRGNQPTTDIGGWRICLMDGMGVSWKLWARKKGSFQKERIVFQALLFRGYVSFRGRILFCSLGHTVDGSEILRPTWDVWNPVIMMDKQFFWFTQGLCFKIMAWILFFGNWCTTQLVLLEEIQLTTWMYKTLEWWKTHQQPQLVQDLFHQQNWDLYTKHSCNFEFPEHNCTRKFPVTFFAGNVFTFDLLKSEHYHSWFTDLLLIIYYFD